MEAQGLLAVVLGICMAVAGSTVAAPTFWRTAVAGDAELQRRLVARTRRWFGRPVSSTLEVDGSFHGHSSGHLRLHQDPQWPAGASVEDRIDVLRAYAAETRRQLHGETRERERLGSTLRGMVERQGASHANRLDDALEVVATRSERAQRQQLAGLPFAVVGVLLTAVGSFADELSVVGFVAILAVAAIVPTALALLVWVAPAAASTGGVDGLDGSAAEA